MRGRFSPDRQLVIRRAHAALVKISAAGMGGQARQVEPLMRTIGNARCPDATACRALRQMEQLANAMTINTRNAR